MTEESGKASSELTLHQAKLLAELQVELSVELGRVSMSAEELLDLVCGQSFPLVLEEGNSVTLRLGAERVAAARLIEAAGEFQLEIVSVDEEISSPLPDKTSDET